MLNKGADMFQNPQAYCYRNELASTHEEAYTRMMIHAKHASASYQNVVIISEDIDVFIILLTIHFEIGTRILLRRGKKNKMRLIDISRLGRDVCASFIQSMHGQVATPYISSFTGQGIVKPLNLIRKKQRVQRGVHGLRTGVACYK